MAVSVVLETDDWLAVDKPAGQMTHPTRPGGPPTLLDALRATYPDDRLHLINRLDRETSGVVLVARNRAAASELGRMIHRGEITKTYLAIVWGHPCDARGEIEAPIARLGAHAPSRIFHKQAIFPDGRPCKTVYSVERRLSQHAILRVSPQTGRLHQIRLHLASIGFPVLGDKIYGPDERCYLRFISEGWTTEMQLMLRSERHALHAVEMAFCWRGNRISARAPWPQDMNAVINTLESNYL